MYLTSIVDHMEWVVDFIVVNSIGLHVASAGAQ